jgi:uncharacterized protein (DUF1330 family)
LSGQLQTIALHTMPAYLIVQARVTDPERFGAYVGAVPALVARFGGCYRVLGGTTEVLEGAYPAWPETKTVVSEWPSRQAALAFWHSPEYRQAVLLREGAGEFSIALVDGVGELPSP